MAAKAIQVKRRVHKIMAKARGITTRERSRIERAPRLPADREDSLDIKAVILK